MYNLWAWVVTSPFLALFVLIGVLLVWSIASWHAKRYYLTATTLYIAAGFLAIVGLLLGSVVTYNWFLVHGVDAFIIAQAMMKLGFLMMIFTIIVDASKKLPAVEELGPKLQRDKSREAAKAHAHEVSVAYGNRHHAHGVARSVTQNTNDHPQREGDFLSIFGLRDRGNTIIDGTTGRVLGPLEHSDDTHHLDGSESDE